MSQTGARKIRNILFIMCDQLRADYLSCYGHMTLATPHIDSLAAGGVRFERAYTQSPNCGPARASFYSGRYVFSHGATWNFIPLPAGEQTLSDYLRPTGMRCAVVGKTHMAAAATVRYAQRPARVAELSRDAAPAKVRDEHLGFIFDWMRRRRNRITISDEAIMKRATPAAAGGGIIGEW